LPSLLLQAAFKVQSSVSSHPLSSDNFETIVLRLLAIVTLSFLNVVLAHKTSRRNNLKLCELDIALLEPFFYVPSSQMMIVVDCTKEDLSLILTKITQFKQALATYSTGKQ